MKIVRLLLRVPLLVVFGFALIHAVDMILFRKTVLGYGTDATQLYARILLNFEVVIVGSVLTVLAFDVPGVPALSALIATVTVLLQRSTLFVIFVSDRETIQFFWDNTFWRWATPFLVAGSLAFFLIFTLSFQAERVRRRILIFIWTGAIVVATLLGAMWNVGLLTLYNEIASTLNQRPIASTTFNPIFVKVGPVLIDPISIAAIFVMAIWVMVVAITGLFGFYFLERRYLTVESIETKRQIAWVGAAFMSGAFATASLAALRGFSADLFNMMWLIPLPLFVGTIVGVSVLALGMFAGGAIDGRLALRKTAIYGFATFVGFFAFAGAENLAADYLTTVLGLPSSLGTWVSAGTAAIAISYARKWMSGRIKGAKPWVSQKSFAAEGSSLQPE